MFHRPSNEGEIERAFLAQAQAEVMRKVSPGIIAAVIERLSREVAVDIDVVVGSAPEVIVPKQGPSKERPAHIILPMEPLGGESVSLSHILDTHRQMGGDRSGLYDYLYSRDSKAWPLLRESIARSGDACMQPMVGVLQALEDAMGERDITLRQKTADIDEELLLVENIHSLGSIAGLIAAGKLSVPFLHKDGLTMERVWRSARHLLNTRAYTRRHALLLLQSARMLGHAILAEAMVRQGHRTWTTIEAMSEQEVRRELMASIDRSLQEFMKAEPRDVPKKRKEIDDRMVELKEIIEALEAKKPLPEKKVESPSMSGQAKQPERKLSRVIMLNDAKIELAQLETNVPKEGESPEIVFMNCGDLEYKRLSQQWLAENIPEQRKTLRDVLQCDQSCAALERLRHVGKWDVLGAKELEIASAVCREVFLFPYQGKSGDREDYRFQSYEIGTPRYALETRRLSCFTGAWLIATLCLESGIHYEQLYYCNVHEWAENTFGAHDVLLLHLSSGNMCFLDYGLHRVGRPLACSMIPDEIQRIRLSRLMKMNESMAVMGHKITGDPVRVTIPRELTEKLKTYSDLHVLPLDQGIAATMQLHTGIALEGEGKPEEALLAYELGLASHPMHVELLCRVGAAATRANECDRAERFLTLALDAYPQHIVTWFEFGVLRLKQNRKREARVWFERVAQDTRAIWSDDTYKKQAKAYLDLYAQQESMRHEAMLTRVEDSLL